MTNLGASIGTALAGAILIATLSSSFIDEHPAERRDPGQREVAGAGAAGGRGALHLRRRPERRARQGERAAGAVRRRGHGVSGRSNRRARVGARGAGARRGRSRSSSRRRSRPCSRARSRRLRIRRPCRARRSRRRACRARTGRRSPSRLARPGSSCVGVAFTSATVTFRVTARRSWSTTFTAPAGTTWCVSPVVADDEVALAGLVRRPRDLARRSRPSPRRRSP